MSPSGAQPARRWRLAAALVAALAVLALLAWRFDWLCDDAYISFRYARHLAEGRGPVFNPGRTPPVEGYSNFLWVVWLGLAESLGVAAPVASRASSLACAAGLLCLVVLHARRRFGLGPAGALATGLLLATAPPFACWSTSGLATMPFALAIFATYERLLGDPSRPRGHQAGLLGLAAALLRADGLIFVGFVLAAAAVASSPRLGGRRTARAAATAAVWIVAGVALHLLWRHATYGEWLPQTARVKAGFSTARLERGLDYAIAWALALPGLAGIALLALRPWPRADRPSVAAALFVLGGSLAYAIWVGGDFMPFGRFLFPGVPFVALLFAGLWQRWRPGARRTLAALAVALSLFTCLGFDPVPEALRRRFDFRRDRQWQSELERWREMRLNARRWDLLGRALALATRPGESLVMGAVGAVGYRTELFLWDIYGLVTPEVSEMARPIEGASPGHDVRVNESAFFDRVDYLGAYLYPRGGLPAEAPLPWWVDFRAPDWSTHRFAPRIEAVERHELPGGEGFPSGAELVLLRAAK